MPDALAGEVQSNWHRDKFRNQWLASELSALATPLSGNRLPFVVSSVTSGRNPVAWQLNVQLSTELASTTTKSIATRRTSSSR